MIWSMHVAEIDACSRKVSYSCEQGDIGQVLVSEKSCQVVDYAIILESN